MSVAEIETCRGESFVGRAAELEALRARLAEAEAGRARIVLVCGEAGIGKTRIVEELLEALPRERVVWGRCHDSVGAPAFWPWSQALDTYAEAAPLERLRDELGPHAQDVARIAPALQARLGLPSEGGSGGEAGDRAAHVEPSDLGGAGESGEQARFQLFEAVADFLGHAAAEKTLAVVLDDLHWADSESLLLLRHLGASLTHGRLLLVGTYREVEMRQTAATPRILADLARVSQRITLRGLAEPDVEAFARSVVPDLPAATIAELHQRTDGNPFFVKQVVALLDREGLAETARLPVPVEVREAVRRRLDPLSEPARRLLASAAVLGREFDLTAVARLAGLDGAETLTLLAEPIAHGLVVETGDPVVRLRFTHALVRDTLYDDLSAAERADLHRAAAELLGSTVRLRSEASLGEIAHHWFRAVGRDALERAADFSVRAAEHAASSLGYEEAAGHYERALAAHRSLGGAPEQRLPLLLAFGKVQTLAGDIEGFRASFLEAAGIARDLGDADALARAAVGFGNAPSMQAVDATRVELLEEALRALGPEDSAIRARVLAHLSMATYYSAPPEERIARARESLEIAQRLGEARLEAVALRSHYNNLLGSPDVEERLSILREAIRAAEGAGDDALACESRAQMASDAIELGDLEGADRSLALAEALAERVGVPRWRWRTTVLRAVRSLLAGELAEADAHAERAMETLQQGFQSRDALGFHAGLLFHIRRAQGRLTELAPMLDRLTREPSGGVWESTQALLYAETDDLEAAAKRLAEIGGPGGRVFDNVRADWRRLPVLANLCVVCDAVGDAESARALEPLIEREATPFLMSPVVCLGASARYLGLLALAQGRVEDAIRRLEAALAGNTDLGASVEVARTQVDLVRALLARDAAGDRERAATLFAAAEASALERGFGRVAVELERLRPRLSPPPVREREAFLHREGKRWRIGCGDESTTLRDVTGIQYLRRLLAAPGRGFAVLDLAGATAGAPESRERSSALDRDRLRDLAAELAEAEEWGDVGRIESLRQQVEELGASLARDVKAGGDSGAATPSPAAQRARLNVSRALQSVIRRIAEECPVLGRHLETAVRTGWVCSYTPDPLFPVVWRLR